MIRAGNQPNKWIQQQIAPVALVSSEAAAVGLACLVGDDAAEDGPEAAGSVLAAAGWGGLVLGSLGGSSVASGASLLASTCGGIKSVQ